MIEKFAASRKPQSKQQPDLDNQQRINDELEQLELERLELDRLAPEEKRRLNELKQKQLQRLRFKLK